MARGLLTGCLANPIFTRLANVKAWFSSMALYSVELLVEIEAPSAEEAAGLALLEARTTTDPLTVSVYSDEPATDRCWRQVVVDVRALEGRPPTPDLGDRHNRTHTRRKALLIRRLALAIVLRNINICGFGAGVSRNRPAEKFSQTNFICIPYPKCVLIKEN